MANETQIGTKGSLHAALAPWLSRIKSQPVYSFPTDSLLIHTVVISIENANNYPLLHSLLMQTRYLGIESSYFW